MVSVGWRPVSVSFPWLTWQSGPEPVPTRLNFSGMLGETLAFRVTENGRVQRTDLAANWIFGSAGRIRTVIDADAGSPLVVRAVMTHWPTRSTSTRPPLGVTVQTSFAVYLT